VELEASIFTPQALAVNALVNQPDCYQDQNGEIELQVMGGTLPYQYSWNTGASAADIHLLGAGLYSCTISDDHGCTQTQEIILEQPEKLNIELSDFPTSICKGDSVLLMANGSLEYVWNEGLSNGSYLTPSHSQEFMVTGTDKNGCIATSTVIVEVRDCSTEEIQAADVYPNPFAESFHLLAPEEGFYILRMVDMNGRLVFSETRYLYKGEVFTHAFEGASGLYVFTYESKNVSGNSVLHKVD